MGNNTLRCFFLLVLTVAFDESNRAWASPEKHGIHSSKLPFWRRGGALNNHLNTPTGTSAAAPDDDADVDDYQWPENLYIEIRDMAATSFFLYSFAYAADVARKVGLKGLNVSREGKVTMPSRDLPRSFTPKEILKIIEENREELKEDFDGAFGDTKEYELLIENLRMLEGTNMM
jgi:hypothetical protein